jgi:hypothetical protein
MAETHLDFSVGFGIAIFYAPVPVALMGIPCLRIRLNDCVASDRCVTFPHRCKVALVERALARGLILLRLAIWMLVLTLIAVAPTWFRRPLHAYGVPRGALELAIRVGFLARFIMAPKPGLPIGTHALRNRGIDRRLRVTGGMSVSTLDSRQQHMQQLHSHGQTEA